MLLPLWGCCVRSSYESNKVDILSSNFLPPSFESKLQHSTNFFELVYIGRWEEIVIRKSQERGWGILESARWAYSPQQFCLVIVGLPDGLIICNIVILCVSIKTRAFQITMFWTWHQGALLMIIYLLGALSSTKNNILSSWHGLVIAWAPSFNKMHVTYMLHCCHLFIIAPLPLPTR